MNLDLTEVLRLPVRTEKSNRLLEKDNQVVFLVSRMASKDQIRRAVQQLFKVQVTSVSTVNRKGKAKRFGGRYGRRDHAKYAFVSLPVGQVINFAEGE